MLSYGGNWVSLLATWKPIMRRIAKHKRTINPAVERCGPESSVMGWRDVIDMVSGYKFSLFSRMAEFTRPMKTSLPSYLVNSISRLDNMRCWMDRFFEPDYADRVKEHPPCGFSFLCPYCRSRYCCKPLYKGLIHGLRRQKTLEINNYSRKPVYAMRVSFRLQWSGVDNCYNIMKKASRVLTAMSEMVQRFKGDRPARVRGGISTANLTYHDGRWKFYFRSVMLQERRSDSATDYLWSAVRNAVRSCGVNPVKSMRSFTIKPVDLVDLRGRTMPTGVVIVRESAWVTRFFDVSAAPPDKILAMMRGRRRMRLQRRFGICHKKHGKTDAMKSIWQGYFRYRGETNATDPVDCSQDRPDDGNSSRQQGGAEVGLHGAEETLRSDQTNQ